MQQAKEINLDPSDFYQNAKGYNQEHFFNVYYDIVVDDLVKEEIAENGVLIERSSNIALY